MTHFTHSLLYIKQIIYQGPILLTPYYLMLPWGSGPSAEGPGGRGDKLWGHTEILDKAATDYTKPQLKSTKQSPNILNKSSN